ncbi:MAG: DUF4446 family protein [Peptococcaceae bacterium]
MENLINLITLYSDYITLAVLLLFFVAFITFTTVLISLNNTKKKFKTLLRGMNNNNLEEIILNNSQRLKRLEEYLREIDGKIAVTDESLNQCFKNFAIERYNAFHGIGGEQSFSLALLDDTGSGVIISSIHGRDDARTYAKKVVEGKPLFNLSDEEKSVLSNTLNKIAKKS